MESAIKVKYNPSYGIIDKDGNAAKMVSNPSYDVTDLSCGATKLNLEVDVMHHRENTSKMDIDPKYQSVAGHSSRVVEIYDVANFEREKSEDHIAETNDCANYEENTVEVEIDSAYQLNARAQDCNAVEICNVTKETSGYLSNHVKPDEELKISKMEIDPIYQSNSRHNRAVEMYDVEREKSEDHIAEANDCASHDENTVEVEIDPAYSAVEICNVTKETSGYLCNHVKPDEEENISKMEIDPIYQSNSRHNRAVEMHDVANSERKVSEDHVTGADKEDTNVEIDPAYMSIISK